MKIGGKFGLKCMILPTGKSAKNPVGRVMGTTSENPGRLVLGRRNSEILQKPLIGRKNGENRELLNVLLPLV